MPNAAQKVFVNEALVPESWQCAGLPEAVRFRVFNPTITAVPGGYAMVYRVVDEEHEIRRLASCMLTEDFEIVAQSVTPLSDLITFAEAATLDERAMRWHADPRFVVLFGGIHLTWNDGGNKPINHQFIVAMTADGLAPASAARELTRDFSRVSTEKNWMLFEHAAAAYAIYAICPHEVLAANFTDTQKVVCSDFTLSSWGSEYKGIYGVLRGSAAPVRDGDGFLVLAHSSYKSPEGRRYAACFYRFEAQPPFKLTHAPAVPFELPNPRGLQFSLPKLNKEVCEVIYPCGIVMEDANAVIAYGINDEACAVVRVSLEAIRASMQPVTSDIARTADSVARVENDAVATPPVRRPRAAGLPLFWWEAKGKRFDAQTERKFATGNFGDIASMDIVQRVSSRRVRQPRPAERKLLSIGSVLHTARDGDIIWGTGAKGGKTELDPSVKGLSVHAVRGPLTLDVLRSHRIDLSKVKELFDPGCLLPLVYANEIRALSDSIRPGSLGYRIAPHYKDDLFMRRREWKHLRNFVSVDATPAEFIASIYGAERVISSSLHGIIFAESLGIPACWHAPIGGEDERKYYDYYFGTGRWGVKRFECVADALRAEPMPLPKFRFEDYLATFPHEELAELGSVGLSLGECVQFGKLGESDVEDFIDQWNFGYKSKAGLWATANRARIQTHVEKCRGISMLEIEIRVRPFNPPQFKAPQRVEITLNGLARQCVEWPASTDRAVELRLRVPHDGSERCFIDLLFEAKNARSPRSLGLSDLDERLAVCLEQITVRQAQHIVSKAA